MLEGVPSSAARRAALTAVALAGPVGWVARAAWGLPTALGAHRRRLRPVVAGSPHFYDGKFHNTLETPALAPANTREGLLRQWHDDRYVGLPGRPVPLAHSQLPAQAAELAATWFGHASALLETQSAPFVVPLGIGSTCASGECPRSGSSSSTGTARTPSAPSR